MKENIEPHPPGLPNGSARVLQTQDLHPSAPQSRRSQPRPAEGPETPIRGADERHSRKCQVCNHPERDAIETEYLDWFNPSRIARHYDIPERALFRHFRAIGMISDRRRNLRTILDRILERGVETQITGDVILRAVRAYTCLTDDNKWVEPPKQVTFSVIHPNQEKAIVTESAGEARKMVEILIDSEPIRK